MAERAGIDRAACLYRHQGVQGVRQIPRRVRIRPFDGGGVINAAAYRAFLLTSASKLFGDRRVSGSRRTKSQLRSRRAESGRLLVLRGRWRAGLRRPLSHLFRDEGARQDPRADRPRALTLAALARGVDYYLTHLFDSDGLPKPFAKAPRLTVYKRELYDCAECINLCLLLRDRFPQLESTLDTVVGAILRDWVKPDGSFRSRQLLAGWDNVPMHRWAQSQMFRSLAFFVHQSRASRSAAAADSREQGKTLAFVPAALAR